MIDPGIIMCNYKKVRNELGTVNYKMDTVTIPDLGLNYDEIYKLKKKRKKEKI